MSSLLSAAVVLFRVGSTSLLPVGVQIVVNHAVTTLGPGTVTFMSLGFGPGNKHSVGDGFFVFK